VTLPPVTPQQVPSTSFPINYSLIKLPLCTICSELLTASLNDPSLFSHMQHPLPTAPHPVLTGIAYLCGIRWQDNVPIARSTEPGSRTAQVASPFMLYGLLCKKKKPEVTLADSCGQGRTQDSLLCTPGGAMKPQRCSQLGEGVQEVEFPPPPSRYGHQLTLYNSHDDKPCSLYPGLFAV
jgi:hypothetical protein